jgi:hypothetical protein
MTTTISSQYPPGALLVFGEPDDIVRPARMIARSHGARTGSVVWVTGSGVEDEVGRLIELLEGDVHLEEVPSQLSRLQYVPLQAAVLNCIDSDTIVTDEQAHPPIPRSSDVVKADVAMSVINSTQAPVYPKP